jgi:hypothetical protein
MNTKPVLRVSCLEAVGFNRWRSMTNSLFPWDKSHGYEYQTRIAGFPPESRRFQPMVNDGDRWQSVANL